MSASGARKSQGKRASAAGPGSGKSLDRKGARPHDGATAPLLSGVPARPSGDVLPRSARKGHARAPKPGARLGGSQGVLLNLGVRNDAWMGRAGRGAGAAGVAQSGRACLRRTEVDGGGGRAHPRRQRVVQRLSPAGAGRDRGGRGGVAVRGLPQRGLRGRRQAPAPHGGGGASGVPQPAGGLPRGSPDVRGSGLPELRYPRGRPQELRGLPLRATVSTAGNLHVQLRRARPRHVGHHPGAPPRPAASSGPGTGPAPGTGGAAGYPGSGPPGPQPAAAAGAGRGSPGAHGR